MSDYRRFSRGSRQVCRVPDTIPVCILGLPYLLFHRRWVEIGRRGAPPLNATMDVCVLSLSQAPPLPRVCKLGATKPIKHTALKPAVRAGNVGSPRDLAVVALKEGVAR